MPARSRLTALLFAVFVFPAVAAASPAPTPPSPSLSAQPSVLVPRGTVVPVLLTKEIRVGGFGHSQEEHKVKLSVAQDVVVDGYLIAKQGDLAEGTYVTQTNETRRIFSANVSQELELDIDDAVFAKGSVLKASTDRVEKSVCAEKTAEEPAPLPSGIVMPDDEVSPQP